MTLQRLLNTIGMIGYYDSMVNFTAGGGSVYELNDLTIKNYPILYASPTGTHRVEENYTTYQLTIFYIDRLLEDNSNAVDIHSAAVEVLKNIIRTIKNTDGVIGVSDEYSINLFTETEKFKDRCNGAYATVEISVVNDTVCEVEYSWNGEPGTNRFIRFAYPAESVTNIPYEDRNQIFFWETSEPRTHYVVYKFVEGEPRSIVMEGITEGDNTVRLLNLSNSGTSVIFYEVQISNEGGQAVRGLNHLPYYFLNYVNRDYGSVEANAQNYLISWETNLENVEWKLYRNNTLYSSGQTTNTSIQVEFPANTSSESVYYKFVAGYPGGGFEKTLNFSQNEAKLYYFRADDGIIPPNKSAVTIDFETNCEGDIRFEWEYWSGTDTIRLNDTTWTYGTPKSIVATAPAERGNTFKTGMYATAYYNGEVVGWVTVNMRNYYFNLLTDDNLKIGSTATSFTINYDTNYPEVPYEMAGVGTGVTSGGTLTITLNENTGTTPVAMEIMFRNTGGNVLGTLHWSQNPVDAYFNILTASGQTISCRTTALTINYETNMTPPYAYSYTNPDGETILGNAWSPSSLTINFGPNDSQSVRVRTVEIGGQTIKWYQAVPYLNFTSYPSEISKEQQLVCFGWACNTGGKVKYELYSGETEYGEMDYVRSGRTNSMSGDCITFSANTGDERYYKLDIAASFAGSDTYYVVSDSITFKQKGVNDSGSTHQYGYDPLRQITGSPQPNQVFYRSSDGQAIPYGLMAGWATDMDGNDMNATSNVYQNGYGIITFPRAIKTTDCVVENKGKLLEIVWPEGMIFLDNFSSSIITEQPTLESVTLPSTLERVTTMAFYNENLQYINLPIGLRRTGIMKALMTNTFNGDVDNLEIYYAGTVAQWNEVKKNTDWLYHKRSGQKVICSDGSVDA